MVASVYSLPDVILPGEARVSFEKSRDIKEQVLIVNLLINNLVQALEVFEKKEYSKLDALVGDCRCQLRAIKILSLASSLEFHQEVQELLKTALKVREEFREIKNPLPKSLGSLSDESLKTFFSEHLMKVTFSSDMAYLLQAHLLTFTKVSTDNVKEKTEASRLDKLALARKIQIPLSIKKGIIAKTQSELSASSVEFIQKVTKSFQEKRMLMVHRFSVGELPKTFVSQYYSLKASLTHLEENSTLVMVKKWLKEKGDIPMKPLFYRGFKAMDEQNLNPDQSVVVFEGQIAKEMDREKLATLIQSFGLKEILLADAAQVDQFEQGVDGLEHIPYEEAKEEILDYRKKGIAMNSVRGSKSAFFFLDHMYCSSIKEEVGGEK